ncbi:MAG: ABC transporter ATP-binding protein [Oscillospiraceae bacterium]|nr:ABC transporter ATP-binding protein [Oscillospiraceae bacterium]
MEKVKKGVRLDHISKIYQDPKTGKDFYAVRDTSLTIEPGSFVTLLGPSGCGKTTTLRMIAGFESPDEGEIYLGEEPINELTPNKRDTAMVFQSYALLPHYNVFDNVAYGLKLRKVPRDEIRERVLKILDLVELTGMEARMTNQLSGGQQQRVALARALVIEPSVLLFDEPLSNLDAKLRVSMRTEIRRIQQEVGITAIYVTHDQSEAMALSDNIIIMNKGVVAQMGTPQEIYYHPVNEFVADFIGEANFLKGTMVGAAKQLSLDKGSVGKRVIMNIEGSEIEVEGNGSMETGNEYTLVLRPEAATLADEGNLPCEVVLSCFMGSYQNYHVKVGNTLVKLEEHNPKNKHIYAVGDRCALVFDPASVHVL